MRSSNRRLGVVVGVDGSARSAVAISWAAREAELRQVPLTLVHASSGGLTGWPVSVLARALGRPPAQRAHQVLDEAVDVVDRSCRARGPAKVITKVAATDPVSALAELSRDAELVVVGARGAGVRPARYGSISSDVMRRAHCAVAVIHDEDPLMPHPTEAPVLVGLGGPAEARDAAVLAARSEASRRGVALIEVPMWRASTDRLVAQTDSAQLVVVPDRANGAEVARSARMPVMVIR